MQLILSFLYSLILLPLIFFFHFSLFTIFFFVSTPTPTFLDVIFILIFSLFFLLLFCLYKKSYLFLSRLFSFFLSQLSHYSLFLICQSKKLCCIGEILKYGYHFKQHWWKWMSGADCFAHLCSRAFVFFVTQLAKGRLEWQNYTEFWY